MEHKFWISIALPALTTFVLGSGLDDSYDPLRYNAPELNAESLYSDQPHSRRKRAAEPIPEATEAVVNDTTLFMYKTGEYENVTTMKVGSRMSFLLAAQFPLETTDFLVELFTPDNESTIMAIYDVEVFHVGSHLSYTTDPVQIIYESKEEDTAADLYLPDRVILDFGNVSHSGATGAVEESMIQIRWSVVMIDSNATVNGTTVWVSAGAEYNNDEEIWIGQASFETIVEEFTSMTPTFNYSGPDTVEIGSTASFTISMVNPYPSIDIRLDVFAPLNDTGEISVCSIAVSDVGSAFACKPWLDKISKTRDKGKLTFFESDTGFGNFRVRLDLGAVTGTGFQDETPPTEEERTITFEFTIAVKNDEAITDEDFWIGAAMTLGDSQIWAGQLQITVVNKTDRNLTIDSDPIVTMTTKTDPYEVGLFYSVKYYLDVEFPENTISDYVLEVLAPFNETAQMRICRVQVLDRYNGVNAPCILSEPEYLKRVEDENAPHDRVVWNIGRVQNNGARSSSDDATANRVRFEIVAQILNHTLNTDGEKAWVTAGLQYSNAESLWVGQNAIVINDSVSTSLDTPDYNMEYTFGDEMIPVGGVGSINLTITTKRGSVYQPMDMEIIMPFENDSAPVTVCRAEITHVGKNMPCTDWAKINSSITYTSKADDPDKPDKAIVNLGYICNVGDETLTEPTDDDKVVITFSFKVQEHVLNEEGKEWWLSAGNMFHDTRMWVGMVKLNITVGPPATYTDEQPYYEMNRTDDTSTDIGIGQTALYDLIIKVPHKTRAHYKITAASGDAKLSICAMRLVEAGWYIPCVDTKVKANVTEYHPEIPGKNGRTNKELTLTLGIISNIGELPKTNDSTFDNHTVRVEILVSASRDASTGDNLPWTLSVDTSGTDSSSEAIPIDDLVVVAATTPTTENGTVPDFNFYVQPVGADTDENLTRNTNESIDIAKGEAVQFRIDIKVPDFSANKLVVKYLTPVNTSGIMEVTDITVTHVGANFPCVDRASFLDHEEAPIPRSGALYPDISDIRSIDLGYLCHYPVDLDDPSANIVTVEGIMQVFKNAPVDDGDTDWASVTVRINEDQIYVAQMMVNIRDNLNESIYTKTIEELVSNYSDTNEAWKFSPSKRYTIPFIVTVAANQTIKAMVDTKMPINVTALGVVEKIRLIKAGRNLAMLGKAINRAAQYEMDFKQVCSSTLNNTQNDNCYMDIGIITNTGVTYRRGDFEEEDNQFQFEADIWIADAENFEENSTHWLSAGAKVGSVIIIVDSQFEAERDNSERPDLCIGASLNSTEISETDMPAEVVFTIQHTNMSTAEAHNVSVVFYFTGFFNFSSLEYCNVSDTLQTTPKIEFDNGPQRKVKFTFDNVLFTDNVFCKVKLDSNDGDARIPSTETGSTQNASTPYEGMYQTIFRINSIYDEGHWFYNSMDRIDPEVVVPGGVSCQAYVLGMQSGAIQDCQITGSHSPDTDHMQHNGRAGSSSYWKPHTRKSRTGFPMYMDIALGNLTKITKISIDQETGFDRVQTMKIMYSNDGINWAGNEMITLNNADSYVHTITSPTEARHVRILPMDPFVVKDNPEYGLRFELEGCVTTADVSPDDVCPKMPWDYDISSQLEEDYYPRGFITDFEATDQAFICDVNPNIGKDDKWADWNSLVNKNARLTCFESTDGDTYKAVDETVINIIGYFKPNTPNGETLPDELFAIDWTKRALMVSQDGITFKSCNPERLKKRKDAPAIEGTFTSATKLDWVTIDTTFEPGHTPTGGVYVQGSWKATYDGMHFGANKKLDWSVCCV